MRLLSEGMDSGSMPAIRGSVSIFSSTRSRRVNDPGEQHRFAFPEVGAPGKPGELAGFHDIGDALDEGKRLVLAPNFACLSHRRGSVSTAVRRHTSKLVGVTGSTT
ncbi:MAG TPA: hypothetical protein VLS27_07105 [Gammaproteobacteria bacterium]|nr:hypothetical protein [Gammaproteobacteria bacterium]